MKSHLLYQLPVSQDILEYGILPFLIEGYDLESIVQNVASFPSLLHFRAWTPWEETELLTYACKHGMVSVVQYMIARRNAPIPVQCLHLALTRSHLDIVRYLVDSHTPFGAAFTPDALRLVDIDQTPIDVLPIVWCFYASFGSNTYSIIQYLMQVQGEWDIIRDRSRWTKKDHLKYLIMSVIDDRDDILELFLQRKDWYSSCDLVEIIFILFPYLMAYETQRVWSLCWKLLQDIRREYTPTQHQQNEWRRIEESLLYDACDMTSLRTCMIHSMRTYILDNTAMNMVQQLNVSQNQ